MSSLLLLVCHKIFINSSIFQQHFCTLSNTEDSGGAGSHLHSVNLESSFICRSQFGGGADTRTLFKSILKPSSLTKLTVGFNIEYFHSSFHGPVSTFQSCSLLTVSSHWGFYTFSGGICCKALKDASRRALTLKK